MKELHSLFEYLGAMGSLPHVSFDLSLARGLDYYTGVIYEVVIIDGNSQVGSIAAGGRYDNLVGMFSSIQTPCVGVSIGIERVFTIIEKKAEELKISQASPIQVYVATIGSDLIAERMRVAKLLWTANIPAEYSHQDSPKFKKQLGKLICILFPSFVSQFSYSINGTVYLYSFVQSFVLDLNICYLFLFENLFIYSYICTFIYSFTHHIFINQFVR